MSKGDESYPGIQLDLVIDRDNNCINIVEAKFYDDEFVLRVCLNFENRHRQHKL